MPKIVSDKELAKKLAERKYRGPGRQEQYPWNEWLDGKWREFENGVDFNLDKVANWAVTCRAAAIRRGLSIESHIIDENRIAIRSYKPGE